MPFGLAAFVNNSTAGHATITNHLHCDTFFGDNSSAGSATIFVDEESFVEFNNNSSAGNATMFGLGAIEFLGSSTAANASISDTGGVGSEIRFGASSSAGNASIFVNSAVLFFSDSSTGTTGPIELSFNPIWQRIAALIIDDHNFPGLTIGSIKGDDTSLVSLGSNNLTVGSNTSVCFVSPCAKLTFCV